jgi:hypothetical protein
MFPPGLRFVAKKIGLPGFRDGQRWGDPETPAPTDTAAKPLVPGPPPSATVNASNAALQAKIAAERQRKRAAGGSVPVTTNPVGPQAKLDPKSLVGY